MKVCGFISSTLSPPSSPSDTSAWNFLRHGEKPWRRTISSTAMKPILCRLPAYFAPGLPRPAMISM
jgi:hypothetical protein